MAKVAKPCTLFTTITTNPGDFVRYLLNGHGMDGHEQMLWGKGIPKAARESSKLAAYWDGIHEKWEEHTVAQAKMTGKQVMVALPNTITDEEIHKIAKAVLRTVPQHHPAMLTVHYTSGPNDKPNIHLQGVLSVRRGGYGKTNDEYRLNARDLAKQAVDKTLKKCGYTIEQNRKVVTTRPSYGAVQHLRRKYNESQLKSPEFLRCFVLPTETGRTRQWLQEEIAKTEAQRFEGMNRFSQDSAPLWNIRAAVVPATKQAGLPPSAFQILKQKVVAPTPTDHGTTRNYTDYLKQAAPPKPQTEEKFNYLEQLIENRISTMPVTDQAIKVHEVGKWGGVSAESAGASIRDSKAAPVSSFSKQLSKISKAVNHKQKGMKK